jgi:hypothetical protein
MKYTNLTLGKVYTVFYKGAPKLEHEVVIYNDANVWTSYDLDLFEPVNG